MVDFGKRDESGNILVKDGMQGTAISRLNVEEIALFSVIDLVASTAAMCEWRTYIPMKVRHEVKALAAGRIFEFYITDDIKPDGERFNWDTYSWEAVESTTCQRYFVDNTKDAQAGDTINLYINSWGGSVKEALGIYNVLRRCGATVVAYIDGVAASAASVIAMAADKVIMPRNGDKKELYFDAYKKWENKAVSIG